MTVAAIVFALLALVVAAFQLALVVGAPWGEFTLGGRWRGALPPAVRAIPLVSAVLLIAMAVVVAVRAGLFADPTFSASAAAGWTWAVVAYCAVGSIANAATPSRRERMLWLPVVLGMLASSLIVALG
ncbi:MAG: hypothetical protein WCK28_07210 [Burkholderiales bacterium]|jgi:hypothetical protein